MKYNLSIFYEDKEICNKSADNIKDIVKTFLNEFDFFYRTGNEKLKFLIEKHYQFQLNSNRNQKKEPFGFVKKEELPNDSDNIKSFILSNYPKTHGGDLEISSNESFFMIFGSSNLTIKNLDEVFNSIEQKIDGIKINFNDRKRNQEKQKINEIKIDKVIKLENEISYNKIIFGPTGTGKSKIANQYANTYTNDKDENILRVTFHPEYSYFDFMGQYKPVVYEKSGESTEVISPYANGERMRLSNSIISYSFSYGIFLEAIIKALSTDENVVLIIEEINRGNCAAIFGDVLQLLDRNENGESSYPLNLNLDMHRYLLSLKGHAASNEKNKSIIKNVNNESLINAINLIFEKGKLYIPNNLILISTMNTSDQSLYPIDAAFKRRWEMEHLYVDYECNELKNTKIEGTDLKWLDFVKNINTLIYKELESEDKQIGQWFINSKQEIKEKDIKNKLLSYLYFDVFKHYNLFNMSYNEMSSKKISELLKILSGKLNE